VSQHLNIGSGGLHSSANTDNRFRWVACQLDELRKCYDLPRLQSTLEALPASLEGTYARVLSQIPPTYQNDAKRLLQCLVIAARPLCLEETVEIIAINPEGNPCFSPRNRLAESEDIVLLCPSLISIVKERFIEKGQTLVRRVVRIAHFSVQEYLVSQHITLGEPQEYLVQVDIANKMFAHLCATYLMHIEEDMSNTPQVLIDYPLAQYAARYWTHHAFVGQTEVEPPPRPNLYEVLPYLQRLRRASCYIRRLLSYVTSLILWALFPSTADNPASMILLNLLCSHEPFLTWQRIYDPDQPKKDSDFARKRSDIASPLYYASLAGLIAPVRLLLDSHSNSIDSKGGRYGFPLIAASWGGHAHVVSLLLYHGAHVNASGGDCGSALYAAADRGHEEVVRLLLDCGADVTATGGSNGQALATAAEKGHKAVVELLLDRGADIHANSGRCGDALQAAVAEGHEPVARLLIKRGANVNARGGVYRNTILAAVWPGHGKVLTLLLDNKIDFDAMDDLYSNALYGATHQGHEALVKELLLRGADVHLQCRGYGTPLYAAALNGFVRIAKVLLDHGVDVNQEGGNYGTPLQASARNGDTTMVKLLLDRGADVDQESGFYGTALFAAHDKGHRDVAELLQRTRIAKGLQTDVELHLEMMSHADLARGTDEYFTDSTHAHNDRAGDLLQAAVYQGDRQIVRRLLERGVPANSQGRGFGKPLYTASARGDEGIVRLLVEAGAELNALSRGFGSALQAAANNGHSAIVQYLLDNGADVNLRAGLHNTALHAAAYESREEIAKRLIDHGADVNAVASDWKTTPLQAACWGGSEPIAALLLEHGAVPDAPGGSWGSAAQAASLRRHDAISELLKTYMPI